MNKRLELIENLKKCEENKIEFETVLKDMNSGYSHGEVKISVDVKSNDYNNKSVGDKEIIVSRKLFGEYVKSEIESLNEDIAELINRLMEVK